MNRIISRCIWLVVALAIPLISNAGLGPQNVLVVVNDASWTSKAVANEYVHLRQIPPGNVVYLKDVPVTHQITIEEFRDSILTPIIETIKEREIESQIECIAYSADFPWKIDLRGDIPPGSNLPRQLTPFGSLTGMTYLHELVLRKDTNYLQLNSNSYARRRAGIIETVRFDEKQQRTLQAAFSQLKEENWEEAAELFEKLLEGQPRFSFLLYHRAVCLAHLKRTEDALDALEKAVENGWMPGRRFARNNEHFAALKEEARYQAILKKMESSVFDVEKAEAFDHQRPFEVPFQKEPVHYLMSVMLGVTIGRGNSVEEIQNSLRRNAAADFTRPETTIYFARNGDIRSTTREPYFSAAVAQLNKLNHRAEIIEATLPKGKQDIGGLMSGIASFNWAGSESILQPGAIAEHLTSFGAMFFHHSGQTPISEWIRAGAAGSSGTVHEPYAIQAKFPTAFLHVHYARGFSLAESFYLSVAGPYQLLILGDPLCQPWATQPEFSLAFPENATLSEPVSIVPESEDNILRYSLSVDGKRFASPVAGIRELLPIENYADGFHTLTVAAIADTSEQTQRIRSYPFRIDRLGKRVELRLESEAPDNSLSYDAELSVIAKCEGADRIEICQNGRILGSMKGESGLLIVPAEVPGIGPVQLYAVAYGKDWTARSEPLAINIAPPDLRLASDHEQAETPGLKLTHGETTTVVDSLDKADWLTQAGVPPDQPFMLAGTYTADRDDLYQLEVTGNVDCRISINGVEVKLPPLDRSFRSIPVSLAAGQHKFEIQGIAKEKPRMQILFGNQGRQPLNKQRFLH